jgi:hypothetical protein
MIMPKYTVRITETQYWYHDFEVEAENGQIAFDAGLSLFLDGMESDDNGLIDAVITGSEVKLDKDFFTNITKDLLRGYNNA